ncbi:MAG: helix-turn-helix domain-containing protein [Actinomycetia bacterium]|nr:helix-turn-helix domain-containing protein [Actinomycetes bacterium]
MADLTPEVINALVRLMNDDTQLDTLDDDALLAVGHMAAEGTELAGRVAALLNARGGWPFAKIAHAWGVHESTVFRWAKAHGGESSPR